MIYGTDALEYSPHVSSEVDLTLENTLYIKTIYHRFYNNSNYGLTSQNILDPTDTSFNYSIMAGQIPTGYGLSGNIISGTASLELFSGTVTEASYPVWETNTDRYYFIIKSQSQKTREYSEKLFYIDLYKNWSTIRDEYIERVQNQDFNINNSIVTGTEYVEQRTLDGDYL